MNYVRRMDPIRAACLACGMALLWSAGNALATEPVHDTRPPTKEMREKMAKVHEKLPLVCASTGPSTSVTPR